MINLNEFIEYGIIFVIVFVSMGALGGILNWFQEEKKEDKLHFKYLEMYRNIFKDSTLSIFGKYAISIIVAIPYTITMLSYFIFSFKFVPYFLSKNRTFL